jgi:hypothetical protein
MAAGTSLDKRVEGIVFCYLLNTYVYINTKSKGKVDPVFN